MKNNKQILERVEEWMQGFSWRLNKASNADTTVITLTKTVTQEEKEAKEIDEAKQFLKSKGIGVTFTVPSNVGDVIDPMIKVVDMPKPDVDAIVEIPAGLSFKKKKTKKKSS